MGLEASCTTKLGGRIFTGRAHLDANKLTFRGGARFEILLREVKRATGGPGGQLTMTHSKGKANLRLADRRMAETWALKIRYPKSLIDKLGVRPESRVAVLGVSDEEFLRQLQGRLKESPGKLRTGALDFIFCSADRTAGLARLIKLRPCLRPTGAIWVVSVKGPAATIKDTDVMRAARRAGLVDTKVCGFSATHTALKLVIPKAARSATAARER